MYVEVRAQLVGVNLLLLHKCSGDQIQDINLGIKYLYLLSHLTNTQFLLFIAI